mgnify:CR=1 FL=1
MKTKILDVYLEDDHFNLTCNATIPGAWVAVIENDYLGKIEQPFARQYDFSNVADALAYAENHFNN